MTLRDHLATGATTICRAWLVERTDGLRLGFTDHDGPLAFDGLAFRPEAGLAARAVVTGTGLAVDNTEAEGILSSDAISEADVEAGRYDDAAVSLWHVNWANVAERSLRFRGTIGEVRRGAGAFRAELRRLSEPLNRPVGRLYQTTCGAALGDARCRVATVGPNLSVEADAGGTDGQSFRLPIPGTFAPRWFERGRLTVLDGAAAGLTGLVKHDRTDGVTRVLELWSPIRAPVAATDRVRVEPGCDKRADTCRVKFANLVNFQGFPFIPGEDWLLSVPARSGANDGGSLR